MWRASDLVALLFRRRYVRDGRRERVIDALEREAEDMQRRLVRLEAEARVHGLGGRGRHGPDRDD